MNPKHITLEFKIEFEVPPRTKVTKDGKDVGSIFKVTKTEEGIIALADIDIEIWKSIKDNIEPGSEMFSIGAVPDRRTDKGKPRWPKKKKDELV